MLFYSHSAVSLQPNGLSSSRQEYWRWHFLLQGDLPDLGIEPEFLKAGRRILYCWAPGETPSWGYPLNDNDYMSKNWDVPVYNSFFWFVNQSVRELITLTHNSLLSQLRISKQCMPDTSQSDMCIFSVLNSWSKPIFSVVKWELPHCISCHGGYTNLRSALEQLQT